MTILTNKKIFLVIIGSLFLVFGFFAYKNKVNFFKKEPISVIFDFDSTIVKTESIVDMLSLALGNDKKKIQEIEKITNDAMNGLLTPRQSMEKRLKFATIDKNIVNKITAKAQKNIVDGLDDLIKHLQQKNIQIYVVSGGFKEIIIPTTNLLGIKNENVYANNFVYNKNVVSGVEDNVLFEKQGKVKLIKKLKKEGKIKGKTIMIGDGYTDLEVGLHKATDDFIAFTGVVEREKVVVDAKKNGFAIAKNITELSKTLNDKVKNFA